MEPVRTALKGQYHAALAMLREAIELCPDSLWNGGIPPRQFWRLAYHTLFFTHLYTERNMDDFQRWEKHRDEVESDQEREKLDAVPYTKAELLEYWEIVNARIDGQLDVLDLTSPKCGIPWYKLPTLDHQMMNIRHVQEHAGQLRDRLLEAGLDVKWVGIAF
jgi:DinB superfamily